MTEDQNDNTETEAVDAEAAPEPEAAADPAPETADTAAPEAEETPAEDGSAGATEPVEALAPKERRRRARAARTGATPARPTRTPEERHAERVAERRLKNQVRRVLRVRTRDKARARSGDAPSPAPPPREQERGSQKTRQGIVVSDRAEKTITVRIDMARRHPRYDKVVRTSRTLHAHDEGNDAHVGDMVTVRECRPLSRSKRWRLVEVIERAK